MSKSKGNIADPIDYINEFGVDALRFYLAGGFAWGGDGNISGDLVKEFTNSYLVNKYSNLISRTQQMLKQYRGSVVPTIENDAEATKLVDAIEAEKKTFISEMESVKISDSTKTAIRILDLINGYIDVTEPWKKEGEELDVILKTLANSILKITIILAPLLVEKTKDVLEKLIGKEVATYADFNTDLSGKTIGEIENLFMRLK